MGIADMASGEDARKVSSFKGEQGRRIILPNPQSLQLLQVTGQATITDSRYSPMKPRSPSPRAPSQRLQEARSQIWNAQTRTQTSKMFPLRNPFKLKYGVEFLIPLHMLTATQ